MAEKKRPDYRVVAKGDADDENSGFVQIGVGWNNESRDKKISYIGVTLYARPWG
jgi:uncharacterized protein (DUF736 family)